MAPHSSPLAWKIPWTEEPGRLQSMGSLRWTRLSDFTFMFQFHALEKEMATHSSVLATHSSVLAWRILGTGEPGGLLSMGSHRVGYDWSDLAAAAAATLFHCVYSCVCTYIPSMWSQRVRHDWATELIAQYSIVCVCVFTFLPTVYSYQQLPRWR